MRQRVLSLQEVADLLRVQAGHSGRPERTGPSVVSNSSKVRPGDVFVVLPPNREGERGGIDYLPDALARGAAVIVCGAGNREGMEALAADAGGGVACEQAVCVTENPRQALGALAAAHYGTEKYRPTLVGLTGTNGKTTSAYMLEYLFSRAGRKTGVIGTIAYRWPGHDEPAPLTTPGCLELHAMFARMRDAGVDTVFMEVSSHALDQERIAGLVFNGALFTNLTQDHLDYHKDMEDYFQAKARLFREPEAWNGCGGVPSTGKARAININDCRGMRLFEECAALPGRTVAFGLGDVSGVSADQLLSGELLHIGRDGVRLRQSYAGRKWDMASTMVGEFNALNLLGVQAVALSLGLPPESLKALEDFHGVPGRLERVTDPAGRYDAFVDYSHTPDSLTKALIALRAVGFGRIIAVFGCGGDRDRGKRPIMGEAVCRYADVAVLTSDNPRTESPRAIMDDVLPGMKGCKERHEVVDRREATRLAVSLMRPGDALLVAGKGHEDYQIIGHEKFHYSDREVLRELLAKL